MAWLKWQIELYLLALSFFTRIPVRINMDISETKFHQASGYFALVGLTIGALLMFSFWLLQLVFPVAVSLALLLAINLLLTGAFHEDGLADVWDGFGGGFNKLQKLNIMKDSRLGTYGASALFLVLLLKFVSWQTLTAEVSFFALLLLANTLSRVLATSLISVMAYVSEDQQAKVKPVAKTLPKQSLMMLLSTGFIVLFAGVLCGFYTLEKAFLLIIFLLLLRKLFIFWFEKQLAGYTGDCLGAAQVISELAIYLFFIAGVSHG